MIARTLSRSIKASSHEDGTVSNNVPESFEPNVSYKCNSTLIVFECCHLLSGILAWDIVCDERASMAEATEINQSMEYCIIRSGPTRRH